ncbi:MAG: hypothetical protein KAQ69_07845 [Spirochaetales bacterium]|nr:hypothetical protein [Spirochaetales bacterium]
MAIFKSKKKEQHQDETLKDEFIEASDIGDPKSVSKVDTEVRGVLTEATKSDIHDILMIDQGRCPSCHGRLDKFLFTVVCPACGWFKRKVPDKGHSHVSLTNGKEIICDYVHRGKAEYLCIKDGVVISEIAKSSIFTIDFVWEENELADARKQSHKVQGGICSWCEKTLKGNNEEEVFEDYVAFGSTQEHYTLCSEKCQRAFRKQYPSRIHRNCYETECKTCNLCIRRFDTRNYKRNILK